MSQNTSVAPVQLSADSGEGLGWFYNPASKGRLAHEDSRYTGNKFSSMDSFEGKVEAIDLFQPSLFLHTFLL